MYVQHLNQFQHLLSPEQQTVAASLKFQTASDWGRRLMNEAKDDDDQAKAMLEEALGPFTSSTTAGAAAPPYDSLMNAAQQVW